MTDEAKALLAQVFHDDAEEQQGIVPSTCLHLDSGLWDCKVRASDAARTEAGAKLLALAERLDTTLEVTTDDYAEARIAALEKAIDRMNVTSDAAGDRIVELEGALRYVRTLAVGLGQPPDPWAAAVMDRIDVALTGAAASEPVRCQWQAGCTNESTTVMEVRTEQATVERHLCDDHAVRSLEAITKAVR